MDIFISYRRDTGTELAHNIFQHLDKKGIRCFLDANSIENEDFWEKIKLNIDRAPNFLMIVTPGYLVKRNNEDYCHKEIAYALEKKKTIIAIRNSDYNLNDVDWENASESIRYFKTFNIEPYEYGNKDVEEARIMSIIIKKMKDERGNHFSTIKKIENNTWYNNVGMSDEDMRWIKADYEVCHEFDQRILKRAMGEKGVFDNRNELNLLVYKAYDIPTYAKKYSMDQKTDFAGIIPRTQNEDVLFFVNEDETEKKGKKKKDKNKKGKKDKKDKDKKGKKNKSKENNNKDADFSIRDAEKSIHDIYGVTYRDLVKDADEIFGNGHFIADEFETEDYVDEIRKMMETKGVEYFDIIDLTLILKDLEKPEELLRKLARLLNPKGGIIYIRELDDDYVDMYPDEMEMVKKLKKLLEIDDGAGNRHTGKKIYTYLKRAGADKVYIADEIISTANRNARYQQLVYDNYFSYLLPELKALVDRAEKTDRNYEQYEEGYRWFKENKDAIISKMCSPEVYFRAGYVAGYGVFLPETRSY